MADIRTNDDRILALKDELQATRARLDEAERELRWVEDSLNRYQAPTTVRHPEGGEVELNLAGRLECLVNPRNERGWITPEQRIARLDEVERLLSEALDWVSGGPKAETIAAEIRQLLAEIRDDA